MSVNTVVSQSIKFLYGGKYIFIPKMFISQIKFLFFFFFFAVGSDSAKPLSDVGVKNGSCEGYIERH
jgi:hypothetical protein